MRTSQGLHDLDTSAARVDVADDPSHVFLWNGYFDGHHRFKQYRRCLSCSFLEGDRTSKIEGHFVRVHFVVAAVVQGHLHVYRGVSGEGVPLWGSLHALID